MAYALVRIPSVQTSPLVAEPPTPQGTNTNLQNISDLSLTASLLILLLYLS